MNLKLAKEIYGGVWFADFMTASQLLKTLDYFSKGGKFEGEKCNEFGILNESYTFSADRISRMQVVPKDTIAMYNFDTVITKYGGYSHYGTKEIADQFRLMESNENVIGHLFFIESGGGSGNAIKYLAEVIEKDKRKKPLVVYSEDVMASAAMYIASYADYIMVRDPESYVGSIGTMMEFDGYKANSESADGVRHIRVYANNSTDKNKEFEEALNNFNFEYVQKEFLNPNLEIFIKDMEKNRPNITEAQKTGAIFKAGDVVGTLIDEIGSFDDAILKVMELAEINNSNNNSKTNTKINMDLKQLQSEHPELVTQCESAGAVLERTRIVKQNETLSKYFDKAPKATLAQISKCEGVTPEFLDEVTNEFTASKFEENAAKHSTQIESQKTVETSIGTKTQAEIQAEKESAEDSETLKNIGLIK